MDRVSLNIEITIASEQFNSLHLDRRFDGIVRSIETHDKGSTEK
jgi:hypothetical protein